MITLHAPTSPVRTVEIESTAGTFSLILRVPTYEERLRDEGYMVLFHSAGEPPEIYAQQMQYRIATAVNGWSRIQDEAGDPLDYTANRLQLLMTQYPDLGPQVAGAIARVFTESSHLGESVAPLSDTGGAETTASRPPLSAGMSNSQPSPTSATSSD